MRCNRRILASLFATILLGSLSLAMLGSPPALAAELTAPAVEKKVEAPRIPADVDYLPDQVYCIPDKDIKLMADVCLPKAGKGPYPVVLCIHGGGWVMGNRKSNLPLMIKLAQASFVAVSVEYRLAPKYPFPAAIHDVKCAVRWLRANANVFNIDTDRIAALGYSAGGQLAGLLGSTTPLDGLEGEGGFPTFSSRVQVVVTYYGIHDLKEWHKDGNFLARLSLNRFLGDSPENVGDLYTKASPITYARRDQAAFLLIHGTKDDLVPCQQSEHMDKRLKAAGAEVQLLLIKDAPHNFNGEAEKEADAATIKYLDENLRTKQSAKVADKKRP
jgi:acetyl esterase/lipase